MVKRPAAPICRYCQLPIYGGFVRCPDCNSVYHLQCARSLGCICIDGHRLNCTRVRTRLPGGRGKTEREGWVTPLPRPLLLASLPWLVWASLMYRFGVWSWEATLWELFSIVLILWATRREFMPFTELPAGKIIVLISLLYAMMYLLANPPLLKILSFISHIALSAMIYRQAKT